MTSGGTVDVHDKLLDGWDKAEYKNGVPYYINHQVARTQWDHPVLVKTLEELRDLDSIRYAAYRTAMKLRFLQKRLQMNLIDLQTVSVIFDRHGFGFHDNDSIDCSQLDSILTDICCKTAKDKNLSINPHITAAVIMNWLLNMFDPQRSGNIRLQALKIALATLASAKLVEKYACKFLRPGLHRFFKVASESGSIVQRKKFGHFLYDFMQLPELLNESQAFGGLAVGAAVENCFQMSGNSVGISEETFTEWMLQEPQTIVWLPMMHRLAASELVKHDAKCSICKVSPITGFRYRCMKCFNYDICQSCFFLGNTSKKHKIDHPTQEYCQSASSKDNTKAILKTMRNNVSKKYKKKVNRPRYLPIVGTEMGDYDEDYCPEPPEAKAHDELKKKAEKLAEVEEMVLPAALVNYLNGAPSIKKRSGGEEEVVVKELNKKNELFSAPPPEAFDVFNLGSDQVHELESVIQHLEDENVYLIDEIEHLHQQSLEHDSDDDDDEPLVSQALHSRQERLEAEKEILDAHNRRLNEQLERLRRLMQAHQEVTTAVEKKKEQVTTLNNVQSAQPNPAKANMYHAMSTPKNIIQPTHHNVFKTPSFAPSPVFYRPPDYSQQDNTGLDTVDATMDSQYMGRTHFTLPTPGQSQVYPDEEAELDYLMEKLNKEFPDNLTCAVGDEENGAMSSSTYQVSNQIGDAMSEFVGKMEATGTS